MKALQRVSPLLQVDSLETSVAYYSKLGFVKHWEDDGFSILSREGCDIFLSQKQVPVDLRNSTARSEPDGYADYDLHFHCAAGSIDFLWEEFVSAGIVPDEFCTGPTDREYGIRDFSIKDPDGYRLVFGAPLTRQD